MSRANFVQVHLAAAATADQTTLSVDAPFGGLSLPHAGGGYLVLTDTPSFPLAFEVITYLSRTGTGPYTLSGVTRGLEGTVPRAWERGAFVMQSLTAGELDELLDAKADKTALAAQRESLIGHQRDASTDQTRKLDAVAEIQEVVNTSLAFQIQAVDTKLTDHILGVTP